MMALTRVYFEEAKNSVFAVALDWPGWCRRAKTLDLALESLEHYRDRYASVVTKGFTQGRTEIVATLRGDVTTAFGAPSQFGPWDLEPLSPRELNRHVEILETCWAYFDQVVETAPAELRKGPRGGGRDRDEMVGYLRAHHGLNSATWSWEVFAPGRPAVSGRCVMRSGVWRGTSSITRGRSRTRVSRSSQWSTRLQSLGSMFGVLSHWGPRS
jgi:hypothetical protein